MHEDREPESTPPESEQWVPPALTDLGSFEEITKLGTGNTLDAEGFSGGPPA
jgi:hypothetical protein